MATTLIDQVNKMMGTPLTLKENPVPTENQKREKTLDGAAVPAALAGIYHLAATKEGAEMIVDHLKNHRQDIENHNTGICAEFTFGKTTREVADNISNYAGTSTDAAYVELDDASQHAYRVMIRDLAKDNLKADDVTKYMVAQRHSILTHLPEELHLGHLIGDETLDDVSNKMEGPISNLMHSLGESFSSSPK